MLRQRKLNHRVVLTTCSVPEAIYAHHFKQLAAWGYGLSEVEQIIVTATATASADSDDDQPQDTAPE